MVLILTHSNILTSIIEMDVDMVMAMIILQDTTLIVR